jgi:2-haloacid dehalogenase
LISRRAFLRGIGFTGAAIRASGLAPVALKTDSPPGAVYLKGETVSGTGSSEQGSGQNRQIKALAFDAYGTLFDVASVLSLCEELFPGKGPALSQMWRTKQLEYSWLRSLMGRYEDFSRITESALIYACNALQLTLSAANRGRLMDAYLHLEPFPEVPGALKALSSLKLAILSNGTPKMLEAVVRNAGLTDAFAGIISVDAVKIFKPSPRLYEFAIKTLGVEKSAIGFVSSNCWDAIGAKSFGFRTFWINRAGAPVDELGFQPDAQLKTLSELPPLLKS